MLTLVGNILAEVLYKAYLVPDLLGYGVIMTIANFINDIVIPWMDYIIAY